MIPLIRGMEILEYERGISVRNDHLDKHKKNLGNSLKIIGVFASIIVVGGVLFVNSTSHDVVKAEEKESAILRVEGTHHSQLDDNKKMHLLTNRDKLHSDDQSKGKIKAWANNVFSAYTENFIRSIVD